MSVKERENCPETSTGACHNVVTRCALTHIHTHTLTNTLTLTHTQVSQISSGSRLARFQNLGFMQLGFWEIFFLPDRGQAVYKNKSTE